MNNEEQVLAQIEDLRGRIETTIAELSDVVGIIDEEDLRGRIDTTVGELSDVVDIINAMERLIVPSQKEESRE